MSFLPYAHCSLCSWYLGWLQTDTVELEEFLVWTTRYIGVGKKYHSQDLFFFLLMEIWLNKLRTILKNHTGNVRSLAPVDRLSHYLQSFLHPRCVFLRISGSNSFEMRLKPCFCANVLRFAGHVRGCVGRQRWERCGDVGITISTGATEDYTPRKLTNTRWWFQTFFIFTPIWGRFPFWLLFFKWVETTN